MVSIGFVGAGNMARALGGGLARSASQAHADAADAVRLLATDPEPAALERFARETTGEGVRDLRALVAASDAIVLAVKPQILPALLPELSRILEPRHLVISIAAGATLAVLSRGLGDRTRIVRAMPNTPALVRQGITALVGGANATPADLELAERIFRAAGDVVVLDDESHMDAITAVSGSGPGFFFAYAEAMIRAAEGVGLGPELGLRLVQRTLLGSAQLWLESGESPDKLRAMVTSPGGTTMAGLAALESEGFAQAVRAAVEAATRRSRELSA